LSHFFGAAHCAARSVILILPSRYFLALAVQATLRFGMSAPCLRARLDDPPISLIGIK
jgi:hypothetical protein